MQVVDKKTCSAVLLHPPQHANEFFISKVVAKQRRKNNIWFLIIKLYNCIIAANPLTRQHRILLLSKRDALGIDVNTNKGGFYLLLLAKFVEGEQVITATASNFTNGDGALVFYQFPHAADCDGVASQPGVYDIKFL